MWCSLRACRLAAMRSLRPESCSCSTVGETDLELESAVESTAPSESPGACEERAQEARAYEERAYEARLSWPRSYTSERGSISSGLLARTRGSARVKGSRSDEAAAAPPVSEVPSLESPSFELLGTCSTVPVTRGLCWMRFCDWSR